MAENSSSVESLFGPIESVQHGGAYGIPKDQDINEIVCEKGNTVAGVVGSRVLASTRIPYDNGYGDFFFGRQSRAEKLRYQITEEMSEEEKLEMAGITGSGGVPVVELNGFKRSGSFAYEKLPIEIRKSILRMLLRPVFRRYVRSIFSIETLANPKKCYPGRKSLYKLKLSAQRAQPSRGPENDWLFLEWIRKASHVSANFRLELAQVLWANVELTGEEGDDNCCAIRNLLVERPSVQRGIRSHIVFIQTPEHGFLSLRDWSQYIAKSLDLEDAYFNISTTKRNMIRVADGMKSNLDGLAPISTLKVSHCCDVELDALAWGRDDFDSKETSNEDGEGDGDSDGEEMSQSVFLSLLNSNLSHLLDIMEPETLKKSLRETTEEEKYLQSRLKNMSEEPSEDLLF